MFIGLDVGGTNTDAVLLNATHTIVTSCKVPTTHHDVSIGIIGALQQLLQHQAPENIDRVCVSSTLALNALLTKRYAPTGLLLVPGPGLAPRPEWQPPFTHIFPGAQDHLGNIIARPDKKKVLDALHTLIQNDIQALGIVSKFSPKNPELEEWLKNIAEPLFPETFPIVLGNSLSGTLNFPRRVATTWCQAALTDINSRFITNLENAMRDLQLTCPLDILKADGGTFAHTIAALNPANAIGSGPAASILGALPEATPTHDSAIISIGGTTTDIAILAAGEPLMLREGLTVDGKPTLIKGMHTQSVALGGDSSLAYEDGHLVIKAERLGAALCLNPDDIGKRPPTLTDALRILDLHSLGHKHDAERALQPLAQTMQLSASETAQAVLDTALHTLTTTLEAFVTQLNSQPVYTIREIQHTDPLVPQEIILIGAPAPALAAPLEKTLGYTVTAPEDAGIANAIGAAIARPTVDAELYADTGTGLMSIAPYGITKSINKRYSMEEATTDITEALTTALRATYAQYADSAIEQQESPVHIVFAETFHTLSGYSDRGKIFRLKAQVSPGVFSTTRGRV